MVSKRGDRRGGTVIYRLRTFVHLREIYARIEGARMCESAREISTDYILQVLCGESNVLFGFEFSFVKIRIYVTLLLGETLVRKMWADIFFSLSLHDSKWILSID